MTLGTPAAEAAAWKKHKVRLRGLNPTRAGGFRVLSRPQFQLLGSLKAVIINFNHTRSASSRLKDGARHLHPFRASPYLLGRYDKTYRRPRPGSGAVGAGNPMNAIRTCSVDDLKKRLGSGDCAVIDVRELPEWNEGHIEATTLLPLSRLRREAVGMAGEVVVVCRSGMRARTAAEILSASGSCRPVVLEGGFEAWKRAGLPYVRG